MEINSYKELLEDLDNGYVYGTINTSMRYPMFTEELQKIISGGKKLIAWQNYGSSANAFTENELRFVIETIFSQTLKQFILSHVRVHGDKVNQLWEALNDQKGLL